MKTSVSCKAVMRLIFPMIIEDVLVEQLLS